MDSYTCYSPDSPDSDSGLSEEIPIVDEGNPGTPAPSTEQRNCVIT